MPQTIDIPGQGLAEFPDGMSHDDIAGVIQKQFFAGSDAVPDTSASVDTQPPEASYVSGEHPIAEKIAGEVLKPATALETTAKDFLRPSSLLQMARLVGGPSEARRQVIEALPGTVSAMQTVRDAKPFSQEWWNAVVPLAAQEGMAIGGIRGGELSGAKPTIQGAPHAIELQNRLFPENVAPAEIGSIEQPSGTLQPVPEPASTQTPILPVSSEPIHAGMEPDASAPKVIPPEGSEAPQPMIDGPHVVSTAIRDPQGNLLTGNRWNEPHDGIGAKHDFWSGVPEEWKGFLVQDENGDQTFATREEAAPIAREAGQVAKESQDVTSLRSEDLRRIATVKFTDEAQAATEATTSQGEVIPQGRAESIVRLARMSPEDFASGHLIHGTNIAKGGDFDYVEPQVGDFTRTMYAGAGDGTFEELGGKPIAYFKPTEQVNKIKQYAEGVRIYPKKGEPYILLTEKPGDALLVKEEGLYDFEGNLISHETPLGAEPGDVISEGGASVVYKIPLKDFVKSGAKTLHEYFQKKAEVIPSPEISVTTGPVQGPEVQVVPEVQPIEQSPTGIRNAIVDRQRVDRGLPERMEPLRKTNPEAWDAAMAKVDENPNAGRELVADIQADPRALEPEQSALLAHEQVTRENTFDSAVDDVNNAKTDDERLAAQQRLDIARNDVQEVYDAGQRVGTKSGQSLQARKLLINQDYTLARMEATTRAISNAGRPLSEAQLTEVKSLHDQLAELRSKLDEAENAQSQEKQFAMYRQLVKESLTSTKETVKRGGSLQSALDQAAAKARERIIARRGMLQVTVDPLNVGGLVDEAIIGASHIARGLTKGVDWSAAMIKDFGERIRPYLDELWDKAKAFHDAHAAQFEKRSPQDIALSRYKTTLANKTDQLTEKVASGDFTKPVRNKTQLDNAAMKAKADYERVRQRFETGLEKGRLAKRPVWQKALEQVAGTARASALSGYHTLLKLATYDLAKFVETPVTEVVGGAISKIPGVRGIAAKANLEAGSTIRPIVDFYVKAATTGMNEAWRVLRTGKTEAKTLYGKPDYAPPKWYDFFGNVHMAEKAPLVTGTHAMYLRRATENAIKAGLDPSNEFTKAAINKAVYDHSQKAILQENNLVASAVNGLHARMEAVNPKTGQADIAKATLSTLAKTFLTKGIVRTPANYISQTIARTPIGLVAGVGKTAMAHVRGIENLHPIEANAIHALLKTGAVGSAMFIWGAIDATKDEKDRIFGGYYAPGRKKGGDDVDWGRIRVGEKQLPHLVTHNPLTESAQMGSTMMRVATSRFRKRDEDTQGVMKGAVTAIVGLAGKAPIASPLMRAGEGRTDTGADLLSGLVPQLLQNIAEDTDPEERRVPHGIVEKVKTAIPILREQVLTPEQRK